VPVLASSSSAGVVYSGLAPSMAYGLIEGRMSSATMNSTFFAPFGALFGVVGGVFGLSSALTPHEQLTSGSRELALSGASNCWQLFLWAGVNVQPKHSVPSSRHCSQHAAAVGRVAEAYADLVAPAACPTAPAPSVRGHGPVVGLLQVSAEAAAARLRNSAKERISSIP